MQLNTYKFRILNLANIWQLGLLTGSERMELEIWFRALEDKGLGTPTGTSVNKVELRLHQLFNDQSKKSDISDGPPHQFK